MATPVKALLFTKTAAYRHASIEALGIALASLPFISLTHTEDPALLQSLLPSQDVLILGHNTRDFLDDEALDALKGFVATEGKGVVGVHAAACGMLGCEWYGKMLGARFDEHPDPQWGRITVHHKEDDHYILRGLPAPSVSSIPPSAPSCPRHLGRSDGSESVFPWFDEWYNFTPTPEFPPRDSTVLVSVDPTTYEGGPAQKDGERTHLHPLTWFHEFGELRTRVFYTALGHFDQAYGDPWFMGMLERGIWWAAKREE